MQSTFSQAMTQAALVIFSLLLNTVIIYVSSNKGTFQSNEVVIDEVRSIATINISNHGGDELEDLKILVPNDLTLSEIRTSLPIKITLNKDAFSSNQNQLLTLNFIPANKTISLVIPFETGTSCCQILNPGKSGIEIVDGAYSPNAWWQSFKYALISVLIYSVFFMLSVYDNKKRCNELDESIKETELKFQEAIKEKDKQDDILKEEFERQIKEKVEQFSALKSDHSELKSELLNVRKIAARFKAINLRRLDDYRRELQFWRDTVRKAMYSLYGNDDKSKDLAFIVTEQLKTYSTRENNPFDLQQLNHILDSKTEDEDSQR